MSKKLVIDMDDDLKNAFILRLAELSLKEKRKITQVEVVSELVKQWMKKTDKM